MSGLLALSVNPTAYREKFLNDLFWLTFYHQHLGERYCGLATCIEKNISIRTHRGLFRMSFSDDLVGLEGTEGIGFCGTDREPFFTDSKLGNLVFCFSGNISNCIELKDYFKDIGHSFERGGDDIEIISKLIIQGEDILSGIKEMAKKVHGAYSFLILSDDGIYAVRGPSAHWPLVIGEKEGAIIIASESGGFSNRGFRLLRDLGPGEIVLIKNGNLKTIGNIANGLINICSFLWVYTGFPNAVFEGIPASLVRKRLGAALARQDINAGFIPDIVTLIPDSGRYHAIGYCQEFSHQMNDGKIKRIPIYDETLLKYPYAGRSYTPLLEEARELEANIKILPSGESYKDMIMVVCDDSLVRGVQTRANIVPKLRSLGVKEIHFRMSNPELRSHCPWGKTTKKGETLVQQMPSKEERINFLHIESLEYNSIKELVNAIGIQAENLCVDCDLEQID